MGFGLTLAVWGLGEGPYMIAPFIGPDPPRDAIGQLADLIVLDPFNYLETNARTIQMAWEHHRQVTNQVREIGERIHAMKKEEARLRAKLKRLQDKDGAITIMRGRERL